MDTVIKETVTTEENVVDRPTRAASRRQSSGAETLEYVIYWVLGILEFLLVFRLVLRLFGANPNSTFVSWIYGLSSIFIWPFQGIFPNPSTEGAVTTAVFEPATFIAIIAYAVLAWIVVKLVSILAGERQ